MPTLKKALVFSLLALSLAGHAMPNEAPDARSVREECSANSQAGMRECLEAKVRESEAGLEQAEKGVREALTRWDENARYRTAARARLDVSNKDFARYRASCCAFNASLVGGAAGNAQEMRRLACVHEVNGQRARQLRMAVVELPTR